MLLLTSTSDKVMLVTSAVCDVEVHASFIDYDGTTVTAGRKNTNITTATTTDVVVSPAAATSRNVKSLHVANAHATTSVEIEIQHTDGATIVQLEKVTLLAGERISYREGVGMRVIDASGMERVPQQFLPGDFTVKALAALVTNSTTTAAKVTGLDTVCGTGTWIFEYFLRTQSSVVTTGVKLGVNHTGTVTFFDYDMYVSTADITTSTGLADQDVVLTTGANFSVWAQRAKSTTAPLITSGTDTINVDNLVMISGLAIVTVSGNMELYHASETAVATRVEAGSALRLTKVG